MTNTRIIIYFFIMVFFLVKFTTWNTNFIIPKIFRIWASIRAFCITFFYTANCSWKRAIDLPPEKWKHKINTGERRKMLRRGKKSLSRCLNFGNKKCSEPESNQRHEDFQSSALPSELSEHKYGSTSPSLVLVSIYLPRHPTDV